MSLGRGPRSATQALHPSYSVMRQERRRHKSNDPRPRLPLAGSNDQRVWHPPPARQRQSQSGELYHELCRRPPVEVESDLAPESTLLERLGKEACEGRGLGL